MKTAIIAGGGLAGLTAAVLLDELGFHVTLIERKPILGGRTFSYTDKITGQIIDNGQHIMIGAYHHTFKFLEKIGAKHKVETLIPTKIPLVNAQGKCNALKIGTAKPPWNLVLGLTRFKGLSVANKIKLIGLIGPLRHMKEGETFLANTTVLNWLKQHKQSNTAIQNFWEPLTLATLNDTTNQTTVDGLIQMIRKAYFGGPNDGFLVIPKEGLSDVFVRPALNYLRLKGCNVRCGIGLKEIIMKNHRVHSYRLSDDSELTADLFVSALPPWDLRRVLPPSFLEVRPELKGINEMVGSPVVTANLFFGRPVMIERFVGLTNAQTHWFFNKSFPALHASRFTLHHTSAIISAAHSLMTQDKQAIINIVLNDLYRIVGVQNLEPLHATVHKLENATLSSRLGINEKRPLQKILDNFYVIGDWTKTDLPATIESAVKSAFLMQDHLT